MTLRPGDVTLKISHEQLTKIAESLREYYSKEFEEDLPEWMLIDALGMWLEHRFDAITEDLATVLSSPSRSEVVKVIHFCSFPVKFKARFRHDC